MPSGSPVVLRYTAILFVSLVMTACAGMRNDPVSPEQPKQQTVTIAVSPTSATVTVSKTQQFQVTLGGTTNTSVTWAVDGISGGNAAAGSISNTGLYTAPSTAGSHTITVTSAADTTKSANASVAVNQIPPPPPPPPNEISVLTERYDLARTGLNSNELILTPGQVNSANFGKLVSYAVDGMIYAQPLIVPNLAMPGGTHNIVLVATEHDSVYAFDADGKTSIPYWHDTFINPPSVTPVPQADVQGTVYPEVGITGTPVIDPSSQTLYVVVFTKENGNYVQRLHALDITTGSEKFGGPVIIQASVPGTGVGNDGNGHVPFQPILELQRPGLLLLKGVIYIAWGSEGDTGPYHGWLMAYSASTLQQLGVWNTTANGQDGAIWQSGTALSADSQGNIYAITANGDFDLAFGGHNASDSVLRLTFNGSTFSVADYFTPYNEQTLASTDNDMGTGGLLLIPGTHFGTTAGKDGSIYVLDLNDLGNFNGSGNTQIPKYLPGAIGAPGNSGTDNNFSSATYFNGNIYYIGQGDTIRQYAFENGQLSNLPIALSQNDFDERGAQAVVSANGTDDPILWAIEYVKGGSGILHAYDANNVSNPELYDSTQAGGRDSFGAAVKFSVPTVANGKVYVGAQGELAIFGIL